MREAAPSVTVFTPTCDTGDRLDRAFRSLVTQTEGSWEWVVVDDSTGPETVSRIQQLADRADAAGRIRLVPHPGPRGSIGAAKAAAAGAGRGAVLVELDHDDELLPDALAQVVAVFGDHSDVDFVYSDWVDVIDGDAATHTITSARYGAGWGAGLGGYASEIVRGQRVPVALAPPVTGATLRHIVSVPNHLRAWRRRSYERLGGHDPSLAVADDYDLLIRTFLEGTMARLPRPAYLQYHDPEGSNASRRRNVEIQDAVAALADRYEARLVERLAALGLEDRPASLTDHLPLPAASRVIDPVAERAAAAGHPLVSVIVPTYRRPRLLARAIRSVLEQTYENLEVLAVGDGCPLAERVVASFDDARVRHADLGARHGDSGASPRNYAAKAMARGTLIAYLDDDNVWHPDHLESLVALLASRPAPADPVPAYAFSSFRIGEEEFVSRRPRRYQIDTSALLHRRELLDRYGYWRSQDDTGYAHDWELVSRWVDEPWAASGRATLDYNLASSRQSNALLDVLRRVADEDDTAEGVGVHG